MKKLLCLILLPAIISCTQGNTNSDVPETIADNPELLQMYEQDQSARQVENIDWDILWVQDSLRQIRVQQLLDSNKVQTSVDYYHAAMIFQHGLDTFASGMAVSLMSKSVELDSTMDKWLLAAAIDRDLMRRKLPQIYGTQYIQMGKDAPWELYTIDTTIISDEERKEYNVETLAEQRETVRQMNQK